MQAQVLVVERGSAGEVTSREGTSNGGLAPMMLTASSIYLGPVLGEGLMEKTCLMVGPGILDAVASYTCDPEFSGRERVVLCHNDSTSFSAEVSCKDKDQGLVLMPLVLAPMQLFDDCRFGVQDLYNVSCLGKQTGKEEEYDRVVYSILDQVSGKNNLSSHTAVERFPVTVPAKNGVKTDAFSAFVAFRKLCKPANPESGEMMNLCSNSTKNSTVVYLTLRGLAHLPHTPSMCQCTLRPTSNLKLSALDVRLQNASNHRCGKSALRIETNSSRVDVACDKMSALYGNQVMYSSDSPHEVTLTLTYISRDQIPTSLWINAQDTLDPGLNQEMSISCGGFIPLPTPEPDRGKEEDNNDDEGDEGGGHEDKGEGGRGGEEEEEEAADAGGGSTTTIVASVLGAGLLIVLILVAVIVRRRCRGSYSGGPSTCCACCRRGDDDDNDNDNDLIFYKPVTQQEPVYAEPGKPRPSTTSPPYFNPADAKFPDSRAIYSEPDPNGTLGLALRATTPPPLPELPPPGSPPTFQPSTPPPKPERTLLRARKESARSNDPPGGEDYDHIMAGGRTPLKSTPLPRGRDGQNNIIGGNGVVVEGNVYDCLQHGDDYSQIGEVLKQQVKDNVYDTTA
ncbi:hypothetical protein ACOMHN_040134 [Nucella lapillus]